MNTLKNTFKKYKNMDYIHIERLENKIELLELQVKNLFVILQSALEKIQYNFNEVEKGVNEKIKKVV